MTTLSFLALLLAPTAYAADDDLPATGVLGGSGAIPWASDDVRREGAMSPWAQLQTWVTVSDQDTDPQADPASYGDPEHDPGFTIARGRLGFDGFVPMGGMRLAQVDYGLSVGIASPYDALSIGDDDVRIVDAFGRLAFQSGLGLGAISIGAQRVPLAREALVSSADLLFQERGLAAAWLVPSRETGAIFAQAIEFGSGEMAPQILVRGGLYNGNGAFFGDDDPGLMSSARLEFMTGNAYRTWSPEKENALGVGVGYLSNPKLATTTGAMAADLLARYKIVTLTGELVNSKITPTDTSVKGPSVLGETNRLGITAQLSLWMAMNDDKGIELGSRYSSLDDATASDDAGDVWLLHNGFTWRNTFPQMDFGVGHIHRTEVNGSSIANDTVRIWTQFRPRAKF